MYPMNFRVQRAGLVLELEDAAGNVHPVRGKPQLNNGHWAKWYILGRWTYNDSSFHRTSVGGQGDADGFVSIDTFFTKDHPAVAYQLRLTIFRRRTCPTRRLSVSRYSAVASNLTNQQSTFPSATT